MLKKILCLQLLFVASSFGAVLEVYQDQSIYKTETGNSFIGFNKNIKASCNGEDLELKYNLNCPKDNRLCKLYNKIKTEEKSLDEISTNIQIIDTLVSTKTKDNIDVTKLLENAKIIAKEKSKLKNTAKQLQKELNFLNSNFSKIAPSKEPVYLSKKCDGTLKITIPPGYINFKPIYEANIKDNEITVTQKVAITNRSGIDINAKEAKLYYRHSAEYISPINFTPWIASESKRIVYSKRMENLPAPKRIPTFNMPESKGKGGSSDSLGLIGKYNDAREYTVENLYLPSSSTPTKVKISEYKSDINCQLKAYPYANRNVFKVCSFKPKYQVDINRWEVEIDNKLINKNAIGRYEDGRYNLYVQVDKDIKIDRRRIVGKERKSGLFGSTRKQKDGYIIDITNKSDREKSIKIIERIPTSNTDKIEVKLLSINPKTDYKLSKNGKLEINLKLKPKEHKTIKVIFELSYNKNLKVNY